LVSASIFSLENKLLLHHEEKKNAGASAVTDAFKLELAPLLLSDGVVLVKLELRSSSGNLVSDNFYWLGAESASYRRLNRIPAASLAVTAKSTVNGENTRVHVELRNTGAVASLMNKLTLLSAADGSRILPAYYSDNYVSLLPGESREIDVEYPAKSIKGAARLAIRGWNIPQQTTPIP
jgi:hypothetical protein